MTDRELLEAAAKAAGLAFKWRSGDPKWGAEHVGAAIYADDALVPWNPLADDGDALRLVVKLHINIEHMRDMGGRPFGVNCWPVGRGDCGISEDGDLSDYNAVTRRAIVRAAAEIGKAMP